MLAYSSVAHAGYLLVAVTAGGSSGTSAFLVYAVAYTLMSLGAFAILSAKGRAGESDVTIDDLSGLAARRPWLAFALAICMLSLLGFPGTAGFIGKWYILIAAGSAGLNVLAVILVLTSVVSAGYYLPVIMAMYMKPEPIEAAHVDVVLDRWGRAAVAAAVVGLLLFGVWPTRLFDLARSAGTSMQPAATATGSPAPKVELGQPGP
jgi:NADH-quinone oxidoreductase subunit N